MHTSCLPLNFRTFELFVVIDQDVRTVLLLEVTLGVAESPPHNLRKSLMDGIWLVLVLVAHLLDAQIFVKLRDELAHTP